MISKITAIGRVEVLNDYTEVTEAYITNTPIKDRPLLIEKGVNRRGTHSVLEYYTSGDRLFNRFTDRSRDMSKRPPNSYYIVNRDALRNIYPLNYYVFQVTPEELLRLQNSCLKVECDH
jgi:hypothetical protein